MVTLSLSLLMGALASLTLALGWGTAWHREALVFAWLFGVAAGGVLILGVLHP